MKKATRKKALKKVPEFKSEAEAAAFWQSHDTTDYLDWNQAQRVIFPNLKPSTTTISLRLPQGLLDDLRVLANERDVPYQSLLKIFLSERIAKERLAKVSRSPLPRRRRSA